MLRVRHVRYLSHLRTSARVAVLQEVWLQTVGSLCTMQAAGLFHLTSDGGLL